MKKLAGGSSVVLFQMRCQLYSIARRTFTLCLALGIFSPTAARSSAVRCSFFGSKVYAKEENLFQFILPHGKSENSKSPVAISSGSSKFIMAPYGNLKNPAATSILPP
jgi:hypothetical protein